MASAAPAGLPHRVRAVWRAAGDALFPPRCLVCRRIGTPLCAGCRLPALPERRCPRCDAGIEAGRCETCRLHPPAFDRIVAACLYDGLARRSLLRLKFEDRPAHARGFAPAMAAAAVGSGLAAHALVPVPLHAASQRKRGFNQAALLARETGWLLELPVLNALQRRAAAPRQSAARDGDERRANVAGAFTVIARVDGLDLWLVDDVCTTGATLDACARALKAAGARHIYGLTAARTPDNSHRPAD